MRKRTEEDLNPKNNTDSSETILTVTLWMLCVRL